MRLRHLTQSLHRCLCWWCRSPFASRTATTAQLNFETRFECACEVKRNSSMTPLFRGRSGNPAPHFRSSRGLQTYQTGIGTATVPAPLLESWRGALPLTWPQVRPATSSRKRARRSSHKLRPHSLMNCGVRSLSFIGSVRTMLGHGYVLNDRSTRSTAFDWAVI